MKNRRHQHDGEHFGNDLFNATVATAAQTIMGMGEL